MRLHSKTKRAHSIIRSFLILSLSFLFSTFWISCETKQSEENTSEMQAEEEIPAVLSIDQSAIRILKLGLDHVSGLDQFQVRTQNTYEDLLNNSIRVDYETSGDVTVDRPDKIRIERYGLEMHQLFFFDGNNFTLHNPYDNVYASESLTGNIEEMFHFVRDNYGLSAPSADLIYSNSFSLLTQNINGAAVIGKEMIGDIMCDHLLFTRPNVSFQIWISESEPYLPFKYVVTDTSTSHLFSYTTLMTEWNIEPELSDSIFQYDSSDDIQQIIFIEIDQAE